MDKRDFDQYVSPYSWRYANSNMRHIWSENNKRRIWRKIWASLAQVESEYGLVSPEQVAELQAHIDDVDISKSLEVEAQIDHDLMAEIQVFADQCPKSRGIIHLGATSVDIKDNATALQILQSLGCLIDDVTKVLKQLSLKIEQYTNLPIIAFTHLQPAEPSTLGYRLSQYTQDILADWEILSHIRDDYRGKGFKGAVGTGASYGELIGVKNLDRFEQRLSQILNLPFYPITTQTYPRKQEYSLLSALAGLGASINKFAFDLRILQSPQFGELSEFFGEHQIGSSAMPFKRNPIKAEKLNSLARLLAQYPRVAWDNAAHSLLERTLDDSANRRSIIPEAFLITTEILNTFYDIISKLEVNQEAINRNLKSYWPFAATERLLQVISKAGADRHKMLKLLRNHALKAWSIVEAGQPNPLIEMLCGDDNVTEYISAKEIKKIMEAEGYLGYAAEKAREFAKEVNAYLQ
ncbi:MAG: adenylosuccinate lyase [Anaerolineales bacterium]